MATATNGTIELTYDTFGSASDPTILLVMGLGSQMIAWQPEFCEMLADGGYQVVRFDNRDAGLSTKTPGTPPGLGALARMTVSKLRGRKSPLAPYFLSDMAGDAMAVLDEVGVAQAHIVGVSMGGMISQTIAIEHPDRVASLTSIMSTTGNARVGQAKPALIRQLLEAAPERPEDALDWGVRRFQNIAGPHFEPVLFREYLEVAFQRSYHPDGTGFQLAAITASPDRTSDLEKLTAPTLVIHGRLDELVNISGGRATARAIPGARLVVHDEMAHDLPRPLWEEITGSIVQHADKATAIAV